MKEQPQPAAITRTAALHKQVIWLNVAGVVLMHAGSLAALRLFSWPAFWTAVGLAVLTCQFGITLGYHRLLTHRSYRVPRWLERTLAMVGCLAFQAGPLAWVATHRLHHKHSDRDQDPHSPRKGFAWSHLGWTMVCNPNVDSAEIMQRLCPDLARDPWHKVLQRHFVAINLA